MKKAFKYIGNALLFNKGYRKAGFLFWFLIASVLGGTADYLAQDDIDYQSEYVLLCSKGDFEGARNIQDKYYTAYSNKYAAWRGGRWNDREARAAGEKYHSIVAYIFSQEITAIYYGGDEAREDKLISRLMAIPTEGAPLAEGNHGNGMFYDNDATIGNGMAIDHTVYQSWVRFYNDRCEQLLDLALADDNKAFAKRVAKLYKPEVKTLFQRDTLLGGRYCIATVLYDNSRAKAATLRVE
jgi:hypothetical protein